MMVVRASDFMQMAGEIVQRRRLRPADAIQVAAAVRTRDGLEAGVDFAFVSADRVQCAAAREEGLDVMELAA